MHGSTLLDRYRSIEGRLAWYCIDHWSEALELDIRALKRTQRHRVCYLPGATDFLAWLREQDKRVLLVTNAHPFTLALKVAETDLDAHVHDMVSSHNFLAPKETGLFWHRFHAEEPFDPSRTVLIEDSVPVLQAAPGSAWRSPSPSGVPTPGTRRGRSTASRRSTAFTS